MAWLWRFRRKPPQVVNFFLLDRHGNRLIDLTPTSARLLSAIQGKELIEIHLPDAATLYVKVTP